MPRCTLEDQRVSCRIVFFFPPCGSSDLNSGYGAGKHLCPLHHWGAAFSLIVLISNPLNLCVQTLWIRGAAIVLSRGSE